MNVILVLICGMLVSLPLQAHPLVPVATDVLQLGKALPLTPEMQALQLKQLQQPHNDTLRLHMAALYLQGARKPGFDAWFHEAQSLLQSLSDQAKTTALYGLLQADIQQQQHQFDAALLTLKQVMAQTPDNVNASLMAARIILHEITPMVHSAPVLAYGKSYFCSQPAVMKLPAGAVMLHKVILHCSACISNSRQCR